MRARTAVALVATTAMAACAYVRAIRPWHLRWGATDEEVGRPMPGDGEVRGPFLVATRAITIAAPPSLVWPWLVQQGYGRAGFYSHDWIDNRGRPSSRRIMPDLQELSVGDLVPTGPRPGDGFRVVAIEPQRSLVLAIHVPAADLSSDLLLGDLGGGRARLVIRLRARFRPGLRSALYYALFEPGDFVMMRRTLLGIRQRAEALAAGRAA